jgi:CHAD domain-containing protein/transposase
LLSSGHFSIHTLLALVYQFHHYAPRAMNLSHDQKQELERILTAADSDAEQQRNARILLLYAEGEETRSIAGTVGLSESRTRYWRKVFEREGMLMFSAGFVPPRRAGAASTTAAPDRLLSEEQETAIRALLEKGLEDEYAKRAHILLAYAVGKTTNDIAAEVGLSPSRTRFWRKSFEREGISILSRMPGAPTEPVEKDEGRASESAKHHRDEVAAPDSRKLPGLLSDDSLTEAGRKVLRQHFEDMVAQGENAGLGEDPEVVHKMRVATRRMRSAFEVFEGAFTEKSVRFFRKPLKRTGKALGRVRDLDVLLLHMKEYASGLTADDAAAFQPLITAWEEERTAHLHALTEYLRSDQYAVFCNQFGTFVRSDGKGSAPEREIYDGIRKRIGERAPELVISRYTDMLAFDAHVATATLDRLHALRIQCKKLRYTLEFLQEVLGPQAKKIIRHVTAMQDYLGHLQDDQTAGFMITSFVQELDERQAHLPLGARLNAAPLLTYLADRQARKHQLLTSFPETWRDFLAQDFRKRLLRTLLRL